MIEHHPLAGAKRPSALECVNLVIRPRRVWASAKLCWRIERDYQELKQEVGLSHFERGWRGFHHHATLCIAVQAPDPKSGVVSRRDRYRADWVLRQQIGTEHLGEVLNLLGIWRGASFACDSANGLGEPSKGAPPGDETTCFAAHA